MKNELQTKRIFLKIMRISVLQLFLALLCIGITYAGELDAQDILDKRISLKMEGKSIKSILSHIESEAKVKFVYSPAAIKANRKTSLVIENQPLKAVLETLFSPLQIKYRVAGERVILSIVMATDGKKNEIVPDVEILEANAFKISGKITDESGIPLIGASVLLKGSTTGTVTDAEGKYAISIPDESMQTGVLVFSYIGYTTIERVINNQSIIDISLETDVKALQDVVVVGYGEVKKSDLTGSVGVAGRKEFGDVIATDATQLVQGKIAGVQVVNNNGLPGSGVNLVIRGTGSFSSVSPLYVIDGIIGDINSVSPYDIDNITVLKDASSVAIYGAQGSNGVVLVTTKRAKTGKPRISYNGYVGIGQAWRKLDMLNASQYIDMVKDYAEATQTILPPKLNTPEARIDRTNWQNEIFRNAKLTEHHINVNGGTDKVTYNFSVGYTDQDAIMLGYNYKRFNFRFNLEENVGRFKLGQTMNVRYSLTQGNVPSFFETLAMPPYAPILDPTNLGGFSRVTSIVDLNDVSNPMPTIFLKERKSREIVNLGQIYGEVQLAEGLKFRSQMSYTFGFYQNYNYTQAHRNGNLLNPNGIDEGYGWYSGGVYENFLSYNKKFSELHQLDVTVGTSYRGGGRYRSLNAIGANFTNDDIKQIGVAGTSSLTGASSGRGEIIYTPIFARVNYTFKDKYLLTLNIRRDYSSNFGANARFGNFPSVALAWKLHEEEFMKGISWLSELKLRGSWGISGNSAIGQFRATETFLFRGTGNNNVVYSLGPDKSYTSGTTVTAVPNPNLRWEETTQTDIGFDASLLEGKIGFTFDYYNRKNGGLLVDVPVPISTGLGIPSDNPSIPANAADAFNRGFEAALSYNGAAGDFKYSVSGNINYNENQVVSLGQLSESPIRGGGFGQASTITYTAAGFPIGSFWGYKVDKIASSQAEVNRLNEAARVKTGKADAVYQAELKPGDIIFQDLNGDGVVDEKDQGLLGSPIPKWNYGLNLNASYKGIDFMVGVQGIAGVQLINALRDGIEGTTRPFNSLTTVLRRWKNDGDVTDIPRAGQNTNGNLNSRPSNRYMESGAYMRVRNITIGYSLPQSFLAKTKTFSSFRIYFTAMNPITITKYKGYDPEVSSSGSFLFSRGVDNGQYPQARSFMLGFQVGF